MIFDLTYVIQIFSTGCRSQQNLMQWISMELSIGLWTADICGMIIV